MKKSTIQSSSFLDTPLYQTPPNTTIPPIFSDTIWLTGIIFIVLSGLLFYFSRNITSANGDMFSIPFFINYAFCITYLVIIKLKGRFWSFPRPAYWRLWLVLAFISCFSLNRTLSIFQTTTDWLSIYLVLTTGALIVYDLVVFLPRWGQHFIYFLLGMGLVSYLYYSIYLLPFSIFAVLVCWFFGISLHATIPFLLFITVISILVNAYDRHKNFFYTMLAGIVVTISIIICFSIIYSQTYLYIEQKYAKYVAKDHDLPAWLRLSQHLPNDWLMERVLKTGIIYQSVHEDIWRLSPSVFAEQREHDPLIVIGSMFTPKPEFSEDEKIKVLATRHDLRHYAQEKLWTGKSLITSDVATVVHIFAAYRLAYTEQTLQIANEINKDAWQQDQEAIYTFKLPEGGVVSSLSLWINDKEEKAYLTTKQKADSAYRTIVGVELRDPSVVHWQEGNRVSVRVFPCNPHIRRKFKIGITAPLQWQDGHLVYDNIVFEGTPVTPSTTARVNVTTDSPLTLIENPFGTEQFPLQHSGGYTQRWKLVMKAPPLASTGFTFQGNSYHIENYTPNYESFTPQKVYLDVNKSWSAEDFEAMVALWKEAEVYVYDEQLQRVTTKNQAILYEKLSALEFSVFPLYLLSHPNQSLFITKENDGCPNLSDFKESGYEIALRKWLTNKPTLRVFHWATHTENFAPYLKTLREFRTLVYAQGELPVLQRLVKQHQFIANIEDDHQVVLQNAKMVIRRTTNSYKNSAPDHVLRLFAYNDIVRKIGGDYFRNDFVRKDLVAIASTANIVTPVSSLVVLESEEDYKRFDIKKSKDSLQNASHKSSGAVPEPHEWLLIGLVVVVVVVMWTKQRA